MLNTQTRRERQRAHRRRRHASPVRTVPGTVLIVDDDEQVLHVLARWLIDAGVPRVLTCGTFDDARSHLTTHVPDVLLTDIRLQGFNGLDLVIRALGQYPEVSAIVLTGFDDPVLRRDAQALGACFLVKPACREALLAAVSQAARAKNDRVTATRMRH